MRLTLNQPVRPDQLSDLYRRAGLARPVDDQARLARMLEHANLLVTAWEGERLIGAARCFCDYGWVCYLSDLAVDASLQHQGLGRALVAAVQAEIGSECQLVLLSAPTAMDYYPRLGFQQAGHAFYIPRPAH